MLVEFAPGVATVLSTEDVKVIGWSLHFQAHKPQWLN